MLQDIKLSFICKRHDTVFCKVAFEKHKKGGIALKSHVKDLVQFHTDSAHIESQ